MTTPGEQSGKINFFCQNYVGSEILDKEGNTITTRDGLAVSQEVVVPNLFGTFVATVERIDGDTAIAVTPGNLYHLVFNQDDRHCWVCDCVVNRKINISFKFKDE